MSEKGDAFMGVKINFYYRFVLCLFFIIFCAVPLMLAFWLLMSIPEGLGDVAAFFAIIGTIDGFF